MSRALPAIAAAALLAAPAVAAGYGFDADYSGAPVPAIRTLDVQINPEVVREARAIAPRSTTRGQQYIDPRDADDLIEDLREELAAELGSAGVYSTTAPGPAGTLVVTINEATPSNPAHTEVGGRQNLDFRSAGRGGATMTATLLAPDGATVADYTYRWEESSFDVSTAPRIGWMGAERAFDRFSSRLARELSDQRSGSPSS